MNYRYEVFIAWEVDRSLDRDWDTDGAWTSPQSVTARSHKEAAQVRISELGNPAHYGSLLVVGNGKARLFRIEPDVSNPPPCVAVAIPSGEVA